VLNESIWNSYSAFDGVQAHDLSGNESSKMCNPLSHPQNLFTQSSTLYSRV